MSQVNINNLRSFLTKIVATQVKTTVPAYTINLQLLMLLLLHLV